MEALRASGADVRVEQVDVADRASVDALLARLSDGPPLRGVFHAAGVLADEPLGQLSEQGLNTVLSPRPAARSSSTTPWPRPNSITSCCTAR